MTINRPSDAFAGAEELLARCARLERELARERAARRAAEDIAEQGLRDLYLGQERLRLLTRIAAFSNDCSDPADALRFAAEQVRAHLGWAVGHALLVAGEAGNERLEGTDAWSLRDPQIFFPFIDASRNLIAWPGDVLPGCLFTDMQPIWVADMPAQAGFTRGRAARRCRLEGAIAVPVLAGRHLVAALEFFQTDSNPPEPGVLDILAQIGAQIGRVFARRRFADQLLRGATTDPVTELPIPFDTIKVDRVFVRHQAEDSADWSIVTVVKALADAMGMQLVIEGVENEYQRAGLADIGCTVGQGYLFNRPLAEEEAARRVGLA